MGFKEFYEAKLPLSANTSSVQKAQEKFEVFAAPLEKGLTKLGFKFKKRKFGRGAEVFQKTSGIQDSLKIISKVAKLYESVGLVRGKGDRDDLTPQWKSGKVIFAKVGLNHNGVVIFFEEPF